MNKLSFATNVSYRDESFVSAANNEDELGDQQYYLNARIGYQLDNLGLEIYGRNLLDGDFVQEAYQFSNGYPGANSPRGLARYSEPRTIGVQLSLSM